MNKPICTHHKPDGTPCRARAIPGRPFCFVHDPEQAEAQAAGRRKGGTAPRHHIRRYPRRLRQGDVAEVLSELLIDAMNNPQAVPDDRLRALTRIAEALLKQPGAPSTLPSDGCNSAPPSAGHLLRVYAPANRSRQTPTASAALTSPWGTEATPAALPAEQVADRSGTGPMSTSVSLPPSSSPSARAHSPAAAFDPEQCDPHYGHAGTRRDPSLPALTPFAPPLAGQVLDSTWTAPSAVAQKTMPCTPVFAPDTHQIEHGSAPAPTVSTPSVPPPCPPCLRGEIVGPVHHPALTAAPPSPPPAAPAPPCRSRPAAPATAAPRDHRRRRRSRPAPRSPRPR
jgi:hypothetical protein